MPEWNPRNKSLINIASKGNVKDKSLLFKKAPDKTAMAIIGVKFGGWGTSLLIAKSIINVKIVTMFKWLFIITSIY